MKRQKVVVVDDEEDIVLYLQTALEDAGYSPFAATNVRDGLKLIRQEKPDLVCLDILMPEESGLSLFRELRSDPELKEILVLIASALSVARELDDVDYLTLSDGTEVAEPDGYLEKPIIAEQFLAKVAALLRRDNANDT